ncbi:MAG: hypothetical protein PHY41_05585, partial [Candidatus Cloacimonetes bacterium]|nr:hypothetical protein [Candidatus Cloacimonadota bacterium]
MKAKLLITILLILLGTAIFASEDPFDAEEYVRKTQELNQLAERFKAETGFRGNVSYDLNRMCLGYYEGKFADIQITAEADTASFRTAFEQIMDKVLPYTFARREQLSRTRITNMHGIIETYYYQQVNGYRVEGAGKLSIAYESGRNAFAIGNGTVELPDGDVLPVLSYDDAVNTYSAIVPNDDLLNMFSNRLPKFRLSYCNIFEYQFEKSPEYRLCWVGGSARKLVIDAISGEIYVNESAVIHSVTVNANGTALLDSDNNGSMDVSNKMFYDTRVYAECDGNGREQYTDIHGNTHFEGEIISNIKAFLESSTITVFDGSSNPA